MKIAVYGGSFNPIHLGHTNLAQSLIGQGLADEVWLMVSPQNPLKQTESAAKVLDASEYSHRLKMAELACEGLAGIRVSDFEIHLPIPSYTITTLTELSATYPQHQFSLVIGADNWERFGRWYKSEEIIEHYPLMVYRRPGCRIAVPARQSERVTIVDTPLYDVSSTEIRNHQKTDMLAPSVLNYIRDNHLYGY